MLDALVRYMRAHGVARVDRHTDGTIARVDLFPECDQPPHPDSVATQPPPPPGEDDADELSDDDLMYASGARGIPS